MTYQLISQGHSRHPLGSVVESYTDLQKAQARQVLLSTRHGVPTTLVVS